MAWGVSENDGSLPSQRTDRKKRWTWFETCDLVVAVKLSGWVPNGPNVNWTSVTREALVLRLTNKTVKDMQKKWNSYVMSRRHVYMSPAGNFNW